LTYTPAYYEICTLQTRHERDWIFGLFHQVKMNGSGFSNYAGTIQSHSDPKKYTVLSQNDRY